MNFYELESHKVMAGLQRGRRVKELQSFLLEQPQVAEIQWNQETYQRDTKDDEAMWEKVKEKAATASKKKKKKTTTASSKNSHPKVDL